MGLTWCAKNQKSRSKRVVPPSTKHFRDPPNPLEHFYPTGGKTAESFHLVVHVGFIPLGGKRRSRFPQGVSTFLFDGDDDNDDDDDDKAEKGPSNWLKF